MTLDEIDELIADLEAVLRKLEDVKTRKTETAEREARRAHEG
jgi:hypothetical protein